MDDIIRAVTRDYYKILVVNLSDDSYEVIKNDENIFTKTKVRYLGLRKWLMDFAAQENVYEDDLCLYEKFVNAIYADGGQDKAEYKCSYRRKSGTEFRWVQMEFVKDSKYAQGHFSGILTVRDIDDIYKAQLRYQEQLEYNSMHDSLTGLYNRMGYEKKLEQWKTRSYTSVCSVYIDVIGLHEVNYHLGHEAGDALLVAVAGAIERHFPEAVNSRIGGDEFTIVLFDEPQEAVRAKVKLMREELTEHDYEISVGVSFFAGKCNISKIIDEAETRMRKDKAAYYSNNGFARRMRDLNEQLETILTEKKDISKFLHVIASEFKGVYFVNTKTDSIRYIYIPEYFKSCLEKTEQKYSDALRIYMHEYMKKAYWERFEELLDYPALEKELSENGVLSMTYEKINNEWVELQIMQYKDENGRNELLWIFMEDGNSLI